MRAEAEICLSHPSEFIKETKLDSRSSWITSELHQLSKMFPLPVKDMIIKIKSFLKGYTSERRSQDTRIFF